MSEMLVTTMIAPAVAVVAISKVFGCRARKVRVARPTPPRIAATQMIGSESTPRMPITPIPIIAPSDAEARIAPAYQYVNETRANSIPRMYPAIHSAMSLIRPSPSQLATMEAPRKNPVMRPKAGSRITNARRPKNARPTPAARRRTPRSTTLMECLDSDGVSSLANYVPLWSDYMHCVQQLGLSGENDGDSATFRHPGRQEGGC